MQLLGGTVEVGGGRANPEADATETSAGAFPDVEAFVEAIGAVGGDFGVTVQAFDARYVVSARHLERAIELADRERARGDGIVRNRSVEILLYAAGRRQIERALEMGVGEETTEIVVLVDGESAADEAAATEAIEALVAPADCLGDYDEARVRAFFDVGDAELAATSADLEALVCERVALLVVER